VTDAAYDLQQLVTMMPFAARLGLTLASASAQEVRGRLAWSAELCTTGCCTEAR